MKVYNNEILTPENLEKNQTGSEFISCKFEGDFINYNFSYTKFTGCLFQGCKFINCNFIGIEGDSKPPQQACENCNLKTSEITRDEFIANLPKVLELSTDATDTADPINGIPDIPADGTSTCTIFIKKKDLFGNYLTSSEDNDTIYLTNTRGKLSSLKVNLVNGQAQVTLQSIPETCVSIVEAKGENLISARIQIQFAP